MSYIGRYTAHNDETKQDTGIIRSLYIASAEPLRISSRATPLPSTFARHICNLPTLPPMSVPSDTEYARYRKLLAWFPSLSVQHRLDCSMSAYPSFSYPSTPRHFGITLANATITLTVLKPVFFDSGAVSDFVFLCSGSNDVDTF